MPELGYVYAVRLGQFVKVGFTARPETRFKGLRTQIKWKSGLHPKRIVDDRMSVIGLMPASRDREMTIHHMLESWRVEGTREWYHAVPALISTFASMPIAPSLKLIANTRSQFDERKPGTGRGYVCCLRCGKIFRRNTFPRHARNPPDRPCPIFPRDINGK
jgi:hypothetical protein